MIRIYQGSALEVLWRLPSSSVHACVTSPPYFGLRDYGVAGQIGLEGSLRAWVGALVDVFEEVRRVLHPTGTLWLNLGDSFNAYNGSAGPGTMRARKRPPGVTPDLPSGHGLTDKGLKAKDLMGQPWALAFALREAGWHLRQCIIWAKPNPVPEGAEDRPTSAHEYIFLMSKRRRYFCDMEAIREPAVEEASGNTERTYGGAPGARPDDHRATGIPWRGRTRNKRSVWTFPTEQYPGAHFATFPTALAEPCIRAGTSEHGVCPDCLAPWFRIVRKTGGTTGKGWHDHEGDLERGQRKPAGYGFPPKVHRGKAQGQDARSHDEGYTRETVGWRPGCKCGLPARIPATVLDPFSGSGTSGLVADRLSRDALLIELNPEYISQAERRIREDCPLFTQVEVAWQPRT